MQSNSRYYGTLWKIYFNICNFFIKDSNALCKPLCPSECNSINYPVQISAKIRTTVSGKAMRSGYTKVRIYNDNFEYTLIEQLGKISIENLIGNVGGVLGLLVGASLISLVEILELLVVLLSRAVHGDCFKKRNARTH